MASTSTDNILTALRQSVEHLRVAFPAADRATALSAVFGALDAHLSAGGTPPEEWREGPDAPGTGSRYWTMPADPDAGHPEPYGVDTYGLVDEEAGGVVAWILTRDRAEALTESLNR